MFILKLVTPVLALAYFVHASIDQGYLDFLVERIETSQLEHKDLLSVCVAGNEGCHARVVQELGSDDRNVSLLTAAFSKFSGHRVEKESLLAELVGIVTQSKNSDARKDQKLTSSEGRRMTLSEFAKDKDIMINGMDVAAARGRSDDTDKKADSILLELFTHLWSSPTDAELLRYKATKIKQERDSIALLTNVLGTQKLNGHGTYTNQQLVDKLWEAPFTSLVSTVNATWNQGIEEFLYLAALLFKVGDGLNRSKDFDHQVPSSAFMQGITCARTPQGNVDDCKSNLFCVWGFISACDKHYFLANYEKFLPFVTGPIDQATGSDAEVALIEKTKVALNRLAIVLRIDRQFKLEKAQKIELEKQKRSKRLEDAKI